MAAPRHNCGSLEGLDPYTGKTKEYWVQLDLIQHFYKKGWLDKYKSVMLAREILKNPAVVFEGLQRDGQEEALCFAGLASYRYTGQGHQTPPPPNMTFVVYVREDDVVFRWDWEAAENLTYPVNYRERFGVQLWPKP